MFVSSANNINYENNEYKTEIASDNVDKGKSIGAPSKVEKKRLETLGLRRKTTKSLKKKSRISIITVEFRDTLIQISING